VNAELAERLASLEAERLRPTPPKPPASPSALAEVVFREIEEVLGADVDGVLGVEPAASRPGPPDGDHEEEA
jgi:hypothetical protein